MRRTAKGSKERVSHAVVIPIQAWKCTERQRHMQGTNGCVRMERVQRDSSLFAGDEQLLDEFDGEQLRHVITAPRVAVRTKD